MKFEHMNGSEVLRLADPQSDLEHKLLSLIEGYQEAAEEAALELKEWVVCECDGCAEYQREVQGLEDELEEKDDEIKSLTELLDTATTP